MKYYYWIFLLGLATASTLAAQTPEKLQGAVIGTTLCVDYDHDNAQTTTVNTAVNLFDGNFDTYFATWQRDEGWAGLDLGEKHVITSIAYCPRAGQEGRVELGVFEGANQPDFGDAIPLCVIPSAAPAGQFTEQAVTCSRGFQYVRYIGRRDVRCNIAELAFYGYASEGDNSHLGQITNLPTVAIHTTNNQPITSKEIYVKGIITVIDGASIHSDSLDIRGRGNASWNFPKKPYRLKLYNKASLLGFPAKEKNWTLINNYGDKTLMRNLVAFDFSRRFEMSYTPAGKPVDVVLNGEYVGTYQLCDQIEVASGRVETDKMSEKDTALPELAGGYLIEIDAYADSENSKFYSNQYSVPVTIKYPKDDEIVPSQAAYIESYFNTLERALFSPTGKDPVNGYRKYMDTHTFVRHFLIGELSGNTDTYWSVYMYKRRADDLFYFGPVWDYDIAFENDNRTYPINQNPNWLCTSTGSWANGMRSWVFQWLSDDALMTEIKTTWAQYRDAGRFDVDSLLRVVDDYAAEMNASQELNFKRWNIMNTLVHQNPRILGSYVAEVEGLKTFLTERVAWMDKKLQYTPKPTGVQPIESPLRLSIWQGAVHIDGLLERTEITVYDLSGRRVMSVVATGSCTLPLTAGEYILSIVAPGKAKETRKISCR